MAFRADEESKEGCDRALNYLVGRKLPLDERAKSTSKLYELIDEYGPVVSAYPHWHPLVASSAENDNHSPQIVPGESCGYRGLDHTIYLRNAFITCPYAEPERVIQSVESLKHNPIAQVKAELLDVQFYMPNAVPILIKCEWSRPMEQDGTIPKSIAVPLLLEIEIPCWRWSTRGETWETMRPYILGEPRGSRSSLFVNQETGQTLKTIWNSLIYTGMFGPLKVG